MERYSLDKTKGIFTKSSLTITLFLFAFCSGGNIIKGDIGNVRIKGYPKTSESFTTKENDIARILAGLNVSRESAYYSFTQTDEFQKHAEVMQKEWAFLEDGNLDAILAWQSTHIPNSAKDRTVFYPLSGADILNAYTLFPKSSDYLMIAMEEPGEKIVLTKENASAALASVRRSLSWFTHKNYFTTAGMQRTLKSDAAGGIMPLMMIFMVRLGHTILHVEAVDLTPEGDLEVVNSGKVKGIHILFKDGNDGKTKRVVYLKHWLDNDVADTKTNMGAFFQKVGRTNLILKAAMYFFHYPNNDGLRNTLLSMSDLVVQDDSGIPHRYFEEAGVWNPSYYGYYVTPVPLMRMPNPPKQPALANGFRENAKPLPFAYGYGALRGKDKCNLTIYQRVKSKN